MRCLYMLTPETSLQFESHLAQARRGYDDATWKYNQELALWLGVSLEMADGARDWLCRWWVDGKVIREHEKMKTSSDKGQEGRRLRGLKIAADQANFRRCRIKRRNSATYVEGQVRSSAGGWYYLKARFTRQYLAHVNCPCGDEKQYRCKHAIALVESVRQALLAHPGETDIEFGTG